MNRNKFIYISGMFLSLSLFFNSCELDEKIQDKLTSQIVQSDESLLTNVMAAPLGQMRNFWSRERIWGLEEATSDELMFPVRGTDWLDNNVWIDNYTHTWKPVHRDVTATWDALSTAISTCNTALSALGEARTGESAKITSYRAQAIFLRSFYEYYYLDLYRIYPFRDPFSADFSKVPVFYKGEAGFNKIVGNLKAILPNMIERSNALYGEPTKDAALMLLAKLYLNKEVYTGKPDYDSCLFFLNQITNYSLADNYFQMFNYDNDVNYKKAGDEAILVSVYDDADNYNLDGQVVWVNPTLHYNQTFGNTIAAGWNGCVAPEGYLIENWANGTDTITDVRWKDLSTMSTIGVNVGFLSGQQYGVDNKLLMDRSKHLLYFTYVCPLRDAKEYQGVRVLKYAPKPKAAKPDRVTNDFIIWRYADVMLMKAECKARLNNDLPGAMNLVNELRTKRKAPVVSASAQSEVLNKIYIERGLELYWEGHRRQDMIRFGTFLKAKSNKTEESPASAILLPIPQSAIDGNKGAIEQNTGY